MTWTLLDTMLAATLALAIVHGSCACDKRRCRWESKYANTPQHDIHGEWVCR